MDLKTIAGDEVTDELTFENDEVTDELTCENDEVTDELTCENDEVKNTDTLEKKYSTNLVLIGITLGFVFAPVPAACALGGTIAYSKLKEVNSKKKKD